MTSAAGYKFLISSSIVEISYPKKTSSHTLAHTHIFEFKNDVNLFAEHLARIIWTKHKNQAYYYLLVKLILVSSSLSGIIMPNKKNRKIEHRFEWAAQPTIVDCILACGQLLSMAWFDNAFIAFNCAHLLYLHIQREKTQQEREAARKKHAHTYTHTSMANIVR